MPIDITIDEPGAPAPADRGSSSNDRTKRRVIIGCTVALMLIVVVAAGSALGNRSSLREAGAMASPSVGPSTERRHGLPIPNRTGEVQLAPPTAAPDLAAALVDPVAVSSGENTGASLFETEADGPVRTPHLIAVDPVGRFAGARSPAFRNPRTAVFTTSADGVNWELVMRWPLRDYEFVRRFEHSGDRFFVWIDSNLAPHPPNKLTFATSTDLSEWTRHEIPLGDEIPDALLVETRLTDLAVAGPSVLALVTTTITIDLDQLELSESDVCSTTIGSDGVIVELCSGERLELVGGDVAAGLPPRHRLYLSTDGAAFDQVGEPSSAAFGVNSSLEAVNDKFVVAHTSGASSVTSTDGRNWVRSPSDAELSAPVMQVRTDRAGDVVGIVGETLETATIITIAGGQEQSVSLTQLLGPVSGTFNVSIAFGPGGWAVDVRQEPSQHNLSWLLHSYDGRSWSPLAIAAPPTANDRRVFVGDDEILIQSNLGTGPVLSRAPLPPPP